MMKSFDSPSNQAKINALNSDSSSNQSAKKNKERMNDFKKLSLKSISMVEVISGNSSRQQTHPMSSTQFSSQRWSFEPKREENHVQSALRNKDNLNNPFLLAKINYLNKQKKAGGSSVGSQNVEDDFQNHEIDNKRTTFRLLKKGSVNQPIQTLMGTQI